ncbi:hypothetical protein GCM10007972_25980 [Iodidimonas muriae]|uniref:Uncharacterized protein n=2 Tax=Iodidimonas muriae TaxID=261467 RepID=A0ABQ2LI75_9PROT|nr:hypothetical protein JCM17843_28480 [Kordiimonadales bacterium JCM 17843]GGO16651.1 hypothetical protein GCM10007972_25980 [Iodidimonas muriae]
MLMATTLMLISGAVHAQTLEQLRTAPKSAERNTEATIGAYAAGYKAGFLCSALFNGGKTRDQIEADELTGIYPLVEDQARQLQAEIDYQAKRVSVAYDRKRMVTAPSPHSAHGLWPKASAPV